MILQYCSDNILVCPKLVVKLFKLNWIEEDFVAEFIRTLKQSGQPSTALWVFEQISEKFTSVLEEELSKLVDDSTCIIS